MLAVGETGARTARTFAQDETPWEPALIEGLAQTAAVVHGNAAGARHQGMLVGVRDFAIERAPRCGETVQFEVQLIKQLAPVTLFEGTVSSGEETLATGNLKFFVQPD